MTHPNAKPISLDHVVAVHAAMAAYNDAAPRYWQAVDDRDQAIWEAYHHGGMSDWRLAELTGMDRGNCRRARVRWQRKLDGREGYDPGKSAALGREAVTADGIDPQRPRGPVRPSGTT